ncbi:MAG: hypothetical protein QOD06_3234 [Candidatus Binatota bacterium]|nr:hypothetical protein [Candidatus Binatota bacterium]
MTEAVSRREGRPQLTAFATGLTTYDVRGVCLGSRVRSGTELAAVLARRSFDLVERHGRFELWSAGDRRDRRLRGCGRGRQLPVFRRAISPSLASVSPDPMLRTGLLAAILAALLPAACSKPAENSEIPRARLPKGTSVLFVTLDTTRRDFLSPYGADPRFTPRLSALAARGATFLNAFSQTNNTNPAHLTMMTGLRAADHGVFDNLTLLGDGVDTLPLAFHRAGFETVAFPSVPHVGEGLRWRGYDRLLPAVRELEAHETTERVLTWLSTRDEKRPFFAWVHYWDAHAPYTPPEDVQREFYHGDPYSGGEPFAKRPFFQSGYAPKVVVQWIGQKSDPEYPRAMYAGEIHNIDRELGRVLEFLDRSRGADRCAVIVIADHGESLGEHDIFFDHRGLYETQLHIPFLLRVPGFPAGLRPATRVSQLDLAPTLVELFGVNLEHELRGSSLVPLLRGEPSEALEGRRWLVHEANRNTEVAVRSGRWKLIWPIEKERPGAVPRLFDLEADPAEVHDLSESRGDVVADLSARLRPWIAAGAKAPHHEVAESDAVRRLKALGYVR